MTLLLLLLQEREKLEKITMKNASILMQIIEVMSKYSWNGAKYIGAILSRNLESATTLSSIIAVATLSVGEVS